MLLSIHIEYVEIYEYRIESLFNSTSFFPEMIIKQRKLNGKIISRSEMLYVNRP